MRQTSGCVHQNAECQVCGVVYQNHKNALALGALHARRTGHHVVVEIGNVVEYNRPEEDEEKKA